MQLARRLKDNSINIF